MDGVLFQEASIFDPRTIPAYINEVGRWKASKKDGSNPPTMSLGMALYPRAIEYLRKLDVSDVRQLKAGDNSKPIPYPVTGIDDLAKSMKYLAGSQAVVFDASIDPPAPVVVGARDVRINMHVNANDNTKAAYEKGSPPRSIWISSRFNDPMASRVGFRYLKPMYPEMVSVKNLFAFELPEEVEAQYITSRSYWDENHVDYRPDPRFDYEHYMELCRRANSSHLRFLAPYLQLIGIVPSVVSYRDYRTNLHPVQAVSSLYDVEDIVTLKSYDSPHIPHIQA